MPDSSDNVLYGASILRTGAVVNNRVGEPEKVSVGCLVRIEMNPLAKTLRITLRTLHAAATDSVMKTLKLLLL
jgi:hypothetical protein